MSARHVSPGLVPGVGRVEPGLVPGVKAVIFDFDGVIVESGDIKTAAFVELFSDLCPRAEDLAAVRSHHLANMGISRFKKFAWIYTNILHRELDDGEKIRLGDRFSALVFEKVCATPFVPGALEALEALHRAAVPLAVASGTPQDELDRVIVARGLSRFFVEVHGSPTEKTTAIASMLRRCKLAPSDVLMIGDGTTDYDAARATSVRFLARRTPELAAHWREVGATCVDDLRGLERQVA